MKKGKKSQAGVVAIILLILLLLMLAALIIILIFNPSISFRTTGFFVGEENACNYPYMQVGNTCCLDKDSNRICDKDETSVTTVTVIPPETPESELICSSPYIKRNNACCLDYDRNGICDIGEDYVSVYRVRRASIDDPFRISEIELLRDTISFRLKNDEDDDLIITHIDIDDCGSENFDRELESGDRKTFHIDCDDRLSRIDSDFEVEYRIKGSNRTEIADGTLEIDKRYPNDYYYDRYYDEY